MEIGGGARFATSFSSKNAIKKFKRDAPRHFIFSLNTTKGGRIIHDGGGGARFATWFSSKIPSKTLNIVVAIGTKRAIMNFGFMRVYTQIMLFDDLRDMMILIRLTDYWSTNLEYDYNSWWLIKWGS